MHRYFLGLVVVTGVLIGRESFVARPAQQSPPNQAHVEWVSDVFKRMQTIKEGMTRGELLKVFQPQGGLSQREGRTYVSRDCPIFKVDVEFRVSGPADIPGEGTRDVIVKISTPYLAWTSVID